jgi:hypothetical protein
MLPLKFMLFSGGPSASVPVAALFHTSASPNLCNRSQRVSIVLTKPRLGLEVDTTVEKGREPKDELRKQPTG